MNDQILEILEKIEISCWQPHPPTWCGFVAVIDMKEISIHRNNNMEIVDITVVGEKPDDINTCRFVIIDKRALDLFFKILDHYNGMSDMRMKERQAKEEKLKEKVLSELQIALNIK